MRMSRAAFRRIVVQLRDAGVDQLGLFFMNEPFGSDELPEAIRWAKAVAGIPYVFLTTHGAAADESRVRACMEAGLDSLKFALNLPPPMPSGTQVPAVPPAVVIENLQAARRARDSVAQATGHVCRLSASSLDLGGEHRTRMAPVLGAAGACVDEHYWLPLVGAAAWSSGGGSDGAAQHVTRKPVPCWTLFAEAHVRADGVLIACCLDASDRFAMADLHATPFAAAWHGAAFRRLRAAHLAGDVRDTVCGQCIAYPAPARLARRPETSTGKRGSP